MPRGWISHLKKYHDLQISHDLPVAVFYAMIFEIKIVSKRKYFCSNLQTCKYTLF